ncbi:DUF3576 domain-containing protein [Pseudomonadota bacterium]
MKLVIFLITLLLSSCNNLKVEQDYPKDPEDTRKMRSGKLFGNVESFNKENNTKESRQYINKATIAKEINSAQLEDLSINNKLWRASLEIMSVKMPLLLIEKNAGLIVTDWSPYGKNEKNTRYKANILIKGKKFNENNLSVSLFKQELKGNKWENTIPENSLKLQIKDEILQKARSYK